MKPAGPTVDVSVADADWREALPDAPALAQAAAAAAARVAVPAAERCCAEVSVLLCDDAAIRDLNWRYRARDVATNVLAFPAEDPGAPGRPRLLGDVVLARETVLREAGEQGKTVAAHAAHLIVHAMLHLLGHDHEEDAAAARMEALEVEALASLGIADPYSVEPTRTGMGEAAL